LLLSARHVGGQVFGNLCDANAGHEILRPFDDDRVREAAINQQRHHHVPNGGERRDQVAILEHSTYKSSITSTNYARVCLLSYFFAVGQRA
jgi:hypothetical protein